VHNAALSGDRLSYACFVLPDLTRGLAPVDIASCARLPEADLPALGTNSWLAGRPALAGDIPIGQLEWERMNVIFPDQAEAPQAGGEGG
jgi:hypothetical protein